MSFGDELKDAMGEQEKVDQAVLKFLADPNELFKHHRHIRRYLMSHGIPVKNRGVVDRSTQRLRLSGKIQYAGQVKGWQLVAPEQKEESREGENHP